MLSIKSQRNLLSFRDIQWNKYHIEIINEKDIKYPHIIDVVSSNKFILEKISSLSFDWYYKIYLYLIMNKKFTNKIFSLFDMISNNDVKISKIHMIIY